MKVTKKTQNPFLLPIKLNSWYALTISPPDRCDKSPKTLYRLDRDEIMYYTCKFSNEFIFYPEFSSSGRLHYHAIVHVSDKYKFYHTKHLLNHLGFCMWKPLNNFIDKLNWLQYCKKDQGFVQYKPIMYQTFKNYKKSQFTTDYVPDKIDQLNDDIKHAHDLIVQATCKAINKRVKEKLLDRLKIPSPSNKTSAKD